MKKLLSLIFFVSISNAIFAQSEPAILLGKGVDAFNNKQPDSAVHYWQLIVKNYKDSTWYYSRAMNNIPVAYESQGNTALATAAYHNILNSDLNDKEDNGNLMEPYTNYKHNACMRMARMYSGAKEYHKALEALNWAEHKYTYQTFSGTSYEKRMVSIASWRSIFYQELGKGDSAIYALVFKILDTDVSVRLPDMSGFTQIDFYGKITTEVVPLIEKVYTKEGFKKELEKAMANLKVSTEGELHYATFQLFGFTYKLPSDAKEYTAQNFADRIKNSKLYEEL